MINWSSSNTSIALQGRKSSHQHHAHDLDLDLDQEEERRDLDNLNIKEMSAKLAAKEHRQPI